MAATTHDVTHWHAADLRRTRQSLRLSLTDLAMYLQVPPRVVRRWESGSRPIPAAIGRDLQVLEQIGPAITELLPMSDLRSS